MLFTKPHCSRGPQSSSNKATPALQGASDHNCTANPTFFCPWPQPSPHTSSRWDDALLLPGAQVRPFLPLWPKTQAGHAPCTPAVICLKLSRASTQPAQHRASAVPEDLIEKRCSPSPRTSCQQDRPGCKCCSTKQDLNCTAGVWISQGKFS